MTLDLKRFEKTSLAREPFEHLVVRESVKPEARLRFWNFVACMGWTAALLALLVRSAGGYFHRIAFVHFRLAGLQWTRGEDLYTNWRGFVYSPTVAAFFAPFAYLPPSVGIVLWQLLNAAALLGGLVALLQTISPGDVRRHVGIICLLLLPLALGNLDIGHSNPLTIGLLMLAVAAAGVQRWNCAALCVAMATSLKIYPLAIGLLICVVAPRPFGWRLLVALLLLTVAPFLFQHWPYVVEQYRTWISTRSADNRLNYPIKYAPLDLWFLLHWVGHSSFPPSLYKLLQLASGGAIALFCAWGKRKRWAVERLLTSLFCLALIWMILLGPATEAYTYVLLAPALILVLVHVFTESGSGWLKLWVSTAFILQLIAAARASFVPGFKPLWIFSAQPLSALLFLGPCLVWLLDDSYWREELALEKVPGDLTIKTDQNRFSRCSGTRLP
jgi:alpha-1,2-mannosyltransferase